MINVLIADDSKFMQEMIYSVLCKIEIIDNFFFARDFKEVMDIIHKEEINLIMLDIVLVNCSGIDILKYVKLFYPDTIVIMCSSMGQRLLIKEAINFGAKDFIIKPFNKEFLYNTVCKYICC